MAITVVALSHGKRQAPVILGMAALVLVSRLASADAYDDFFRSPEQPSEPPGQPSASPSPGPAPPAAADDAVAVATIRPPVATTALEVAVRPAYRGWISGSVGQASIGSVFSPGAGLDLEAGIRTGGKLLFYAAWSRAAYGVGEQSPYAKMATSKSYGDAYLVGMRGLSTSTRKAAAVYDIAVGFSRLHQEATDAHGGTASIDLPSFEARVGLGAGFRLSREVGLEPMVHATLGAISGYDSTVAPSGATSVSTSGSVESTSMRMGFAVGLTGTFDLALSDD